MIAERFPALASLSVLEKWTLAEELYEEVESCADEVPVDPEVLAAIEARFSAFESGMAVASPWGDVKARRRGRPDHGGSDA